MPEEQWLVLKTMGIIRFNKVRAWLEKALSDKGWPMATGTSIFLELHYAEKNRCA